FQLRRVGVGRSVPARVHEPGVPRAHRPVSAERGRVAAPLPAGRGPGNLRRLRGRLRVEYLPDLAREEIGCDRLRQRPAEIAAQLSFTKVQSRRRERRWRARATSSLPVPVSPVRSTVASVGATVSTASSTRLSTALSPTISSKGALASRAR